MAKQIGEETKITLDLKTIGMIVTFVVMLAGSIYFKQFAFKSWDEWKIFLQ